jgi:hypothetical protein
MVLCTLLVFHFAMARSHGTINRLGLCRPTELNYANMLDKIRSFFRLPELSSFDSTLTHQRLIQCGRIAFIDDERPLLIDELRQAGFAIDHDSEGNELTKYDGQLYDVAILDYHGVGQRLGQGQGLDMLRYIRRVSPRTRVIAYTSRSLSASESEFFRSSHVVLPKDLGIGDSLAVIEGELKKALSKEHLFDALIQGLNIKTPDAIERLRKALVKSLANGSDQKIREAVIAAAGATALKAGEIIIGRFFS